MNLKSQMAWLKELKASEDYAIQKAQNAFAVEVEHAMMKENVNRSELAEKLGSSPAYITKVLRGDANLTIATMAKLARALDYNLTVGIRKKAAQEEFSSWLAKYQTKKFTGREDVVARTSKRAANDSHANVMEFVRKAKPSQRTEFNQEMMA